ncbi:hypothetical protein D3C77_503710 [compost metagenome]
MVLCIPGLQTHAIRTSLAEGKHRTPSHIPGALHRGMIGLGNQHQGFIAQRYPVQSGQCQWAIHQGGVQATGEQAFKQFAARRRLHLQVHCRIGLVITRQQRWQVDRRRAVHGPQGKITRRLPTLHGGHCFIAQRQHASGVIEQDLTRRRQLQALAFTTKQFHTQLLFKLAQARRQV